MIFVILGWWIGWVDLLGEFLNQDLSGLQDYMDETGFWGGQNPAHQAHLINQGFRQLINQD